jgi:hypothetical protein
MKITINRLRDASNRKLGSGLAEAAHKTMPLITQGSTASADRQGSLARERAKLDAYNRQLAARNCKTLDIDEELARGGTQEVLKFSSRIAAGGYKRAPHPGLGRSRL